MRTPQEPERPSYVRALLIAGMVVSAGGLIFVLSMGPLKGLWGGMEAPALARASMRILIVNTQGRPVSSAEVFLLAASSDTPADASWVPAQGTLTLGVPAGTEPAPRSVRVTARGYRTREVKGILRDQRIVLMRGLLTRFLLKGVPPEGIPRHIRVLLRVKPAGADPTTAGAAETIELMDNLGGPGSGPRNIPRGGFGYPVSLAQARAGVLLPEIGAYHVHWGLIDTRAQTWYSLGKGCGRRIRVRDLQEAQTFVLAMTLDDLQRTLEGLASRVKRLRK